MWVRDIAYMWCVWCVVCVYVVYVRCVYLCSTSKPSTCCSSHRLRGPTSPPMMWRMTSANTVSLSCMFMRISSFRSHMSCLQSEDTLSLLQTTQHTHSTQHTDKLAHLRPDRLCGLGVLVGDEAGELRHEEGERIAYNEPNVLKVLYTQTIIHRGLLATSTSTRTQYASARHNTTRDNTQTTLRAFEPVRPSPGQQ